MSENERHYELIRDGLVMMGMIALACTVGLFSGRDSATKEARVVQEKLSKSLTECSDELSRVTSLVKRCE